MKQSSSGPGSLSLARMGWALAFGLFLGLCLWKFGNPVILDSKISDPATWRDFLTEAWPPRWAGLMLAPLTLAWLLTNRFGKADWKELEWWGLAPLFWLVWNGVASIQSQDTALTLATLVQFTGCVVFFFIGWLGLKPDGPARWMLALLLPSFLYCLIQAFLQHQYIFPQSHQMLVEGEKTGWTNFPAAFMEELRSDQILISTNGMQKANPVFLAKFAEGRVNGTMVYPNALAGLILLLFPVAWVLTAQFAARLRPVVRWACMGTFLFLAGTSFYWTGSKSGWLIALGVCGLAMWRIKWPGRLKKSILAIVLVTGLGCFALRFHHYFSHGATSVTARLDYWHAAVQICMAHPWVGSGPGTFQHPYALLKAPSSEMARLTHNDYLEQFSDSGVPAGLAYLGWVAWALLRCGNRVWTQGSVFEFGLFLGVLAWFTQGFCEFSLYIPALAWLAFALLGSLMNLRPRRDTIRHSKPAPVPCKP